jgi:hypothetical protein
MFPPPSKSRLSIWQSAPDLSIKSTIRSAIQMSLEEWLMKTVYRDFFEEGLSPAFALRFRALFGINDLPFKFS